MFGDFWSLHEYRTATTRLNCNQTRISASTACRHVTYDQTPQMRVISRLKLLGYHTIVFLAARITSITKRPVPFEKDAEEGAQKDTEKDAQKGT